MLDKLFNDYLLCGGYLRAINDLATDGKILDATFATYEQWIRSDFSKRGFPRKDPKFHFLDPFIYQVIYRCANQLRPNDLTMLKQFKNSRILVKKQISGNIENVQCLPVYQYLYDIL